MGFAETLAARKVRGQKGAFLSAAGGECQAQGCDQSAATQSAELARQIYDIVGLSGLDTVWLATDAGAAAIRLAGQGAAGVLLGPDGDTAGARGLLDALLSAPAAAPAGGGDAVNQLRKVATEYLTDFAETALMIQIKQSGLDEKHPTPEALAKLAGGLEKAALMIIGPTRSKEMGEKLKKAIS
ncbi:MAG: hypothetical protein MUF78_00045 [Candidatus Edwardsbacteria bacterium]|jgi:hypothetical protein|nr:hypothetical protein [Candidatus Edwardsbacteria bacterium]